MVDYGLICTLQLYYGATVCDKQTAARTRTRGDASLPLKTLSYSQDVKLWHSTKLFLKLRRHLLTGVSRVCLMNIGTGAQRDAEIHCAQLPPLIKPTRDKPIREGCCHYLDSCTHGANLDRTGTELAKLRAQSLARFRITHILSAQLYKRASDQVGKQLKSSVAVLIKHITTINVIRKY